MTTSPGLLLTSRVRQESPGCLAVLGMWLPGSAGGKLVVGRDQILLVE